MAMDLETLFLEEKSMPPKMPNFQQKWLKIKVSNTCCRKRWKL